MAVTIKHVSQRYSSLIFRQRGAFAFQINKDIFGLQMKSYSPRFSRTCLFEHTFGSLRPSPIAGAQARTPSMQRDEGLLRSKEPEPADDQSRAAATAATALHSVWFSHLLWPDSANIMQLALAIDADDIGEIERILAVISDEEERRRRRRSSSRTLLINTYTDDRPTPLYAAVSTGKEAIVALLLRHGADPNAAMQDGLVPLHAAAELGLTSIAKALVSAGADIEARYQRNGATPLIVAATAGKTTTAIALLELGADPNAAGNQGITPLDQAARGNDAKLILSLIKHKADIHARSTTGWTPLHVAAGFDSAIAVAVLIHHGANANTIDDDGDTPLITATSLGFSDTVHQLLASGADPRVAGQV